MNFFDRHEQELFPIEPIEVYQRTADQVTESRTLVNEVYDACYLDQLHPWDTPNEVRLSLVFAGLAFVHDRTAERLLDAGIVTDKHGVSRATQDIATFGAELSARAAEDMKNAGLASSYFRDQNLESDEVREAFDPERQLPYWPLLPNTSEAYDWQHPGAYKVTPAFITGIVAAARDIEAEAADMLRRCQEFDGPKPEWTQRAADYITDNILAPAATCLTAAETGLTADMPSSAVEVTYRNAHDGYIRACWALSITAAPQLVA